MPMASPSAPRAASQSNSQAPTSAANSPAPSHGTSTTFGAGGGSAAPPPAPQSNAGGLQPPGMQRSVSASTNVSSARGGGPSSEPPHVIEGPGGRVLCVADVRGNISSLNQLAADADAQAIIHTGDFGFYENSSFERISDRTLRHLVQYSTLIPAALRAKLLSADPPRGPASAAAPSSATNLRAQILAHPTPLLSEFPLLLNGQLKLSVPVYTVWGACEDVAILERFRTGEYAVPNLHVLDEATTRAIEVGGVRLRLFGLGGAVVLHKLFDNGEGAATIAGGQGTMWTTVLQIGELVDTAQKSYDPTETRLLVTHASPGREGLLAQLALALKADLTISAGLHFRYGVSYNEFSVQHDAENFRNKLANAKVAFGEVWDTVRTQVEAVIDDNQRILLNNALAVTNRVPPLATATGAASEEPAWKNTWNWNLPDAAYGSLVLDIKEGRVSAETKSQGFNFAYRRNNQPMSAVTPTAAPGAAVGRPLAVSSPGPAPAAAPATGAGAGATANKGATPESAAAQAKVNGAAAPANGATLSPNDAANQDQQKQPAAATDKTPSKGSKAKRNKERGNDTAGSRSDIEGLTSGAESMDKAAGALSPATGSHTPTSRGAPRNPYTIFVSQIGDALPVSEEDLRAFFGPAASGITTIKLVFDHRFPHHRRGSSALGSGKEDTASGAEGNKRQRPFAYVEFGDEQAMREGLKRQGQTLKGGNVQPKLEQADQNREQRTGGKAQGQGQSGGQQAQGATATPEKEAQQQPSNEGPGDAGTVSGNENAPATRGGRGGGRGGRAARGGHAKKGGSGSAARENSAASNGPAPGGES